VFSFCAYLHFLRAFGGYCDKKSQKGICECIENRNEMIRAILEK
jgi:hypothetical protein